jgi:AcrR family transcriptional regulator
MVAPVKALTERQLQRREDILTAARKLITERGYDGVNMRDLAKESGVAPKTLYHQFENKEKLLRAAVEERFRYLYQLIDDEEVAKGIDRLYFILDSVADSTKKNLAYARALTPLLTESLTDTFSTIRMKTYRKAIDQIAREGELVKWVDVEILHGLIYRQINPIYLSAARNNLQGQPWVLHAKLDISLIIASVSSGYTHDKAIQVAQEMQASLKR